MRTASVALVEDLAPDRAECVRLGWLVGLEESRAEMEVLS